MKVAQGTNLTGKKILVAYFSRADENYAVGVIEKGNTQILAEFIAELSGADLFKIETLKPYPKAYKETADVGKGEQKQNARPQIRPFVGDMSEYDVLFIGAPTWWGDLPMGVFTFLESVSLQDKVIYFFNTHEGSGLDETAKSLERTVKIPVLGTFSIRGATAQNERERAKSEIKAWLDKISK